MKSQTKNIAAFSRKGTNVYVCHKRININALKGFEVEFNCESHWKDFYRLLTVWYQVISIVLCKNSRRPCVQHLAFMLPSLPNVLGFQLTQRNATPVKLIESLLVLQKRFYQLETSP